MKNNTHKLAFVLGGMGRNMEDEYERVQPAHEKFWKDEAEQLTRFSYEHAGCPVRVIINWGPYSEGLRQHDDMWGPAIRGSGAPPDPAAYKAFPKVTECSALVEVGGDSSLSGTGWYPAHFLERALYDAFICANLALPGVLDLYSAKILRLSEHSPPTELKLSAYNFEFWWVESLRGHFPKLRQLPLKGVREWYALTGISGQSRARSGLERAVFCLFHLCRSDNYVDGLIWVFHALEALLETRIGENLSGMLRRISLLTDLSERDKKTLKKHLRRAYDIRSAFVHGGYEITHPAHNEVIDPEIGKAYGECLDLQQFGMALILSILQHLVVVRASNYHFREVFVPHIGATK